MLTLSFVTYLITSNVAMMTREISIRPPTTTPAMSPVLSGTSSRVFPDCPLMSLTRSSGPSGSEGPSPGAGLGVVGGAAVIVNTHIIRKVLLGATYCANYFTILDLNSGYWQVKWHRRRRKLLLFLYSVFVSLVSKRLYQGHHGDHHQINTVEKKICERCDLQVTSIM